LPGGLIDFLTDNYILRLIRENNSKSRIFIRDYKYRKSYSSLMILMIKFDNEISLALQSTAPDGPNENPTDFASEYFNNYPFKTNQA